MAVVASDNRWFRIFSIWCRATSGIALAIGLAEIAVWLSRRDWIDPQSAFFYMKANTALSVVLLAIGCLLSVRNQHVRERRAARLAGLLVFAIASLTLSEYISGHSFGIDSWFGPDPTVDHGRMAAQSAITLALASIALQTFFSERGALQGLSNAAIVGALVMIEIMITGFVDRATLLYDVTGHSPTAPQSAIAMVLIVFGILSGRAAIGRLPLLTDTGRGSTAVRAILPAIVALPMALGQLRWMGESAGLFTAPYGETLFTTAQTLLLGGLVIGFARSMNRIDARYRRERAQREEYERYVAVCAWTRRVRWEGEWLSIEEFLHRRFKLEVTHGMSDEVFAAQLAELSAHDQDASALMDGPLSGATR